MNYNVLYTENFLKEARRLLKKYNSFKDDNEGLIISFEQDPTIGKPPGNNCYKLRLAIASKRRANLAILNIKIVCVI